MLTYRYDAVSFSASIACQSAPTPSIQVSSLVCEFQLYDAVVEPAEAWNGGANGLKQFGFAGVQKPGGGVGPPATVPMYRWFDGYLVCSQLPNAFSASLSAAPQLPDRK